MKFRIVAALAAFLIMTTGAANAHVRHHHRHHHFQRTIGHLPVIAIQSQTQSIEERADPRPGAWCAWWLRRYLGIARSAFRPWEWNLARGFLYIGTPAPLGCTGCIAIFSRGHGGHVGLVKNWDANGNPVILSGNYGGRVAVAAHSARRLIGLRWPT